MTINEIRSARAAASPTFKCAPKRWDPKMTDFKIRFTLSAPGTGLMQNPARCVEVQAPTADAAMARVNAQYAKKGRNPRLYAIEIDGVWRRIEMRAFADFSAISATSRPHPDFGGMSPEIVAPIANPKPMEVERPEWARA